MYGNTLSGGYQFCTYVFIRYFLGNAKRVYVAELRLCWGWLCYGDVAKKILNTYAMHDDILVTGNDFLN